MTGRVAHLPPVIPEREVYPADAAPVHGCVRCALLANARARARIYMDDARVTAANVAIRRHPRH